VHSLGIHRHSEYRYAASTVTERQVVTVLPAVGDRVKVTT
jgi:hypothetical protein